MPLGNRLRQQGWMLFGNKWCPFCKRQKEELGEDLRLIQYIDADDQKSLAIAAGADRFPSWWNSKTSELRVGFKTRYELYQMSQPYYSKTLNLQTAPDGTVRMPQSIAMPEIYGDAGNAWPEPPVFDPERPQSRGTNPWTV